MNVRRAPTTCVSLGPTTRLSAIHNASEPTTTKTTPKKRGLPPKEDNLAYLCLILCRLCMGE